MSDHFANFKSWYTEVLAKLYTDRNTGLVVFMISFPLVERYLRQKSGLDPNQDLSNQFMNEFRKIFPVLRDDAMARQFWNVYRNGFLHQAALSRSTRRGALPAGALTHDISDAIKLERDGSFLVNPVLFSQRIVREIEEDFSTFVGANSTAPAFPTVVLHVLPVAGTTVQQTVLKTN
ncbi:MAG TPA: hypothetical protein PLO50_15620 [Nitrospira sp.]|nr:hypothetical protein [Nitrospira sp.]